MYKITKEFAFCYGHRVWSQELNKDFALDECLMCRHLHGHQAKILVTLEAKELKNGMVTDFKHLNWFKKFLDDVLDHKFIIDINDPLFGELLPLFKDKKNLISFPQNYQLANLTILKDKPKYLLEMYESFIIVDFVPTSENLSMWFLEIIQQKMKSLNIKVSSVEFFETPKSKSMAIA